MPMQYISENTGEPVVIECRFCRQFADQHVPATVLAGQWEGGDPDVDPRWVPVCAMHFEDWWSEEKNDYVVPPEQRLPCFPLITSNQEG